MAKDAVNVDIHLFVSEILDKLHVTISDCIHERTPVVGSKELVNEMRKGIEEVYYLLCLSRFYISKSLPIQQKILLTYGCLVTWL